MFFRSESKFSFTWEYASFHSSKAKTFYRFTVRLWEMSVLYILYAGIQWLLLRYISLWGLPWWQRIHLQWRSSIPGLGRSPGEGKDSPFQYACLESCMNRRAWWVTVYRVKKESVTAWATNTSLHFYHSPNITPNMLKGSFFRTKYFSYLQTPSKVRGCT